MVDLQGLGHWVEPILRFTFARVEHESNVEPASSTHARGPGP